jgi:hypothetical protein
MMTEDKSKESIDPAADQHSHAISLIDRDQRR